MGYYARYVPVAERRAKAAKEAKKAASKGQKLNPVCTEGRQIAHTFWGKAWCENLEKYSDYENRLPRGRTYLRNGSLIDLQVAKGKVTAQVMGSSLYKIAIEIQAMSAEKWKALVQACAGKIDSLIELLQGQFSKAVMSMIVDKERGLFPKPSEISMRCSCPDHAGLCKHIAAVLYGIGTCLDTKPEWFFLLRHVDHLELVGAAGASAILNTSKTSENVLEESSLAGLFGIDMAAAAPAPTPLMKPKKEKPDPIPLKTLPAPLSQKNRSTKESPIDLTISEAALLLQISVAALTQLMEKGKIPFHQIGKQRRISFEEIVKYRKSC